MSDENENDDLQQKDPSVIELLKPVKFGKKSEPVTVIKLKPNGRALRDLEVQMGTDGKGKATINMKPHALCVIGLRMAGIAGDEAFVDMMDARDIWEVSQKVVGFIMSGSEEPETATAGDTPSP